MKTVELIIKQNSQDEVQTNANSIVIPSIIAKKEVSGSLSLDIMELLRSKKLSPSENSIDLLNLGLAVYTLDQLVSRSKFGHYQWTRNFKINLPVLNFDKWNEAKILIEEALAFLSGDRWTINLSEREKYYENEPDRQEHDFQKVCLFSGGLDSLVGAVNLIEEENIVLVGHHKKGGYEKLSQTNLLNSLLNHYTEREIENLLFYVQPEKSQEKDFGGEDTQRARSFLFLVLGIVVANSYGTDIPLFVPENGLISLNLPLTQNRQGTHSTKTTHPFFISAFESILREISIENKIVNPFQHQTKGEMIDSSKNKDLIIQLMDKSISCSKSGYHMRWHGKDKIHCGYCIPCIIRRAALHRINDDKASDYVFDVRTFDLSYNKDKGADIHAFNIAIHKYLTQRKLNIFEILKSGNLPEDEIEEFLDTAKRGIKEVDKFIKNI
jgi:7-cyano-7-deazaguanine synthase in queuosine biosynthesis